MGRGKEKLGLEGMVWPVLYHTLAAQPVGMQRIHSSRPRGNVVERRRGPIQFPLYWNTGHELLVSNSSARNVAPLKKRNSAPAGKVSTGFKKPPRLTRDLTEDPYAVARWLNLADMALGRIPRKSGKSRPVRKTQTEPGNATCISWYGPMESELKRQSQQAMHGAEKAQKRSIACQARAEELAHKAVRLTTHAQELKDDMNEAANRAQLRSKVVAANQG